MATTFSFDITSDFDSSELDHAIDQAKREMTNRYDFKGTNANLEYSDEKRAGLKLEGDSDYQLDALIDMVRTKLAKRNLSQKILDVSQTADKAGMILRKQVPFVRGLDQEKAKKITKLIRDKYPKVKPQIQGEIIRVSSQSKDDLQGVMALVKAAEFDFPINFENYR
jgi:uncharacterized protein YajQ (UPF0234 family)